MLILEQTMRMRIMKTDYFSSVELKLCICFTFYLICFVHKAFNDFGLQSLKKQQIGFTCLKNKTLTISKYGNKFWMMCDRHRVASESREILGILIWFRNPSTSWHYRFKEFPQHNKSISKVVAFVTSKWKRLMSKINK